MQEHNYLPVNWTDGMKINKSHFIAQDNAFMYRLAQNTGSLLHECNFGLLPAPGTNTPGVKLFLNVDNQQQVRLRMLQCRAITRGGYYIRFEEETALHADDMSATFLQLSVPLGELTEKASLFHVVISINPYQHVPFGLANVEETPPRLPYSMPAFTLSLIPVQETGKNLLGLFQLPVGQLVVDGQRVFLDHAYIPPCSTLSSHYDLLEIHAGMEQFYSKMEIYALQIIQKIFKKKQTNEIAAIVQKLCENIIVFTASQVAETKTIGLHQSPVYLVNQICSMARIFINTLDCYIGSGKEELINYCTEWYNVSQGELEGTITALTNHQYDHLHINASIDKVLEFTKIISGLFGNLARLEYIGKRKDAGIFVKEQLIVESEEPRKRRSFLAD